MFDGGGIDVARGVATDAGANVIVHGYAQGADADIWTRKLDRDGTEVWTRVVDNGFDDRGTGVTTDLAGNVVATGSIGNGNDTDIWVNKDRP